MIFICHSCHTISEPENAGIQVLKKYLLNPALVSELEFLLATPVLKIKEPPKAKSAKPPKEFAPPPRPSITPPKEEPVEHFPTTPQTPKALEATDRTSSRKESLERITSSDEAHIIEELKKLESALSSGNISEAEYDRKFVRLKLQLRRVRTQANL
jgi:hypothetical protein